MSCPNCKSDKVNKEQAKKQAKKYGWSRQLGYSKKELGIEARRRNRQYKCGCVYKYESGGWIIKKRCPPHQRGFEFKKKYMNK